LPKVLIVDDDSLVLRSLQRALQRALSAQSYHVVALSDVHEAMRVVEAENFDCVLCDIRMPKMSGLGFARFVRSLADVVLPDTAGITVKAITINPDAEITLVPGQSNDTGVGEDYTLKQPIRRKAHAAELIFETTARRPEIRNVSIEAAGPSNPPTETRNAA
jgi:CheY-like chemotaxis protein